MAPIKLEEHIREKLQERELQPSKGSWEKLAAQLDASTPVKRQSKRYLWLAVAASLVAILVVGSLLFNQNGDVSGEKSLVDEEVNDNSMKDSEVMLSESTSEEDSEENKMNSETETQIGTATLSVEPKRTSETHRKVENQIVEDKKETLAVNNTIENQEEPIDPIPETPKEKTFFDTQVDKVVASVQGIQKDKGTVTPEEIDELLTKAQREIQNRRILNSENNKIDATALLEDVEWELERTFRDKVFDALGDGFQKIRTAVAERNN